MSSLYTVTFPHSRLQGLAFQFLNKFLFFYNNDSVTAEVSLPNVYLMKNAFLYIFNL